MNTVLKQNRIGILMGGLSEEREVSLSTGRAIRDALAARDYCAIEIDVNVDIAKQLQEKHIDIAFIALHGRYGEDGCIQGLLESLQIPFTGSGVLGSALGMDKVTSKRLFDAIGMPTAPWRFPATPEAILEFGFPSIIKPRGEGSSVRLSIVRQADDISAALELAGGPDRAFVERYIPGREFSVAILGAKAQARSLGAVEICPAVGFYDYAAKYERKDTQYRIPPDISTELRERMESIALSIHRLFECRGATRTDFMWSGQGDPVVLEINTLPGMTTHSLLPKLAAHCGLSFEDLVETILMDATLKRLQGDF